MAVVVADSKIVLCRSKTLINSFGVPVYGLLFIFFGADTFVVADSEVILCFNIPLFGSFLIPRNGLFFVFFDYGTLVIMEC